MDGSLAGFLLAGMIFLSLLCWGPIPIACLWVGSEVNYLTGSVSFGILAAFGALFALLFGALALLKRMDNAWILVRRAAGLRPAHRRDGPHLRHHRVRLRGGLRLLVPDHPRPRIDDDLRRQPRRTVSARGAFAARRATRRALLERGRMGLLDYYKQFEGMSEEEVNAGLREEAAERRRKALTKVETLDLSHTTWPELPHPRIVNAITFVARRGLHHYPYLRGTDLRNALAERHGVDASRLVLGNGAAELLSAATRALIAPGQQLLTRWPSYPLYPLMARRAHGQAVPVEGGVDALLAAASRTPTSAPSRSRAPTTRPAS